MAVDAPETAGRFMPQQDAKTLFEFAELNFYFVAGEASGDRHAAYLWREIKKNHPKAAACGVGGCHLKSAGQKQLFDLASHAVVGLTDVLANYFKFRDFFYRVLKDIREKKPDALILVDYPGFNLRLAKKIRSLMPDLPIIYYISPQVWAWKASRSRLMREVVDLLLIIFPFEKDWFARHEPGLHAHWVGHPLLDRWLGAAESFYENGDKVHRIALLPGSRRKEIDHHLPILLETARRVSVLHPQMTYMIPTTDEDSRDQIERIISASGARGLNLEIHTGYQLTHLSRCDLAIVASGSATLECCVAGLPMLVIYKANSLTFWLGRRLVKLPYISMVNILAEEKVAPEFLQENATAEHLTEAIRKMIEVPRWRTEMKQKLAQIAGKLGSPGASHRAADAISHFLAGLR